MSWAAVAQRQDGLVTRLQLRACGLSESAIDRMLRSESLVGLSGGVFVARGAPLTYRARLWHAVLSTRGVLGFGTGAHLWEMADDPPPRVEIVVADGRHVRNSAQVRVYRVFVPASAVQRHGGLPITTRRWTLLDHLGRLPSGEAVRLADRALQRRWLSIRDVEHRLAAFPCRTGNSRLREVVATCSDGAAAQSERVLHRLLRAAGVQGWTPNYPVWGEGDLVGVVDVAFPDLRLAIEIDGLAHHTDVDRFQRDRARQNALVSLGWTVLRFTWADLTQRPGYVLATIRRHLAHRGRFAS